MRKKVGQEERAGSKNHWLIPFSSLSTVEECERTFSCAQIKRVIELLETLTTRGEARQLDDGRKLA